MQGCDSTIEVCSLVKVVDVDAGFKYNKNAFRNWGAMSATMMGYSSWAASPYTNANDVDAAFLYNFVWVFITWGMQFFFWVQKALFKSEGGSVHAWFMKFVNLGIINFALAYWMIDFLTVRAISISNASSKGEFWQKWTVLLVLQIVSIFIQVGSKGSLDFDYKLATAAPVAFKASTYDPASELELPEGEAPQPDPAPTSLSKNTADEQAISDYWGF